MKHDIEKDRSLSTMIIALMFVLVLAFTLLNVILTVNGMSPFDVLLK